MLRDRRWFMWLPFKLLCGSKASYFFSFKEIGALVSAREYHRIYEDTCGVHIHRTMDLNSGCLREIVQNAIGTHVLDAGCGRGYLAGILSRQRTVTAVDIHISDETVKRFPGVRFTRASLESLPFDDGAFDTVVCTHTLEHVPDIVKAACELRRVARKRLMVVVPKQRPYRFTTDLHLHFFPYPYMLYAYFRPAPHIVAQRIGVIQQDIYYQEDFLPRAQPVTPEGS